MALVEKLLEDLPKDADTMRHVQEWVNSAVTGDDTDGAESEDQRTATGIGTGDRHRCPLKTGQLERGRTVLIPTLDTCPKRMMRRKDTTERGRQLISAGRLTPNAPELGKRTEWGLGQFQPP